jgi:hypothetical protein
MPEQRKGMTMQSSKPALLANLAETQHSGSSLFKASEAARYLGFTEGWLAKMRVFGNGPHFVKLGRQVRYRRADLDEWAATNRHRSTSEYQQAA